MPAKRLIEDVARLGRLELPTYRFEVCRSIHLSYRRTLRNLSDNATGGGLDPQLASVRVRQFLILHAEHVLFKQFDCVSQGMTT